MPRICPKPLIWAQVHEALTEFASSRACTPTEPPKPLILSGWTFTNDAEKARRWTETVLWAEVNDCADLTTTTSDEDFYSVEVPTSYVVGPLGGPMYLPWDFTSKSPVGSGERLRLLELLARHWPAVAGELSASTRPIALTGAKARRLLVRVTSDSQPPWGTWTKLSHVETNRRAFTRFRAGVNRTLAPNAVDHIAFTDA